MIVPGGIRSVDLTRASYKQAYDWMAPSTQKGLVLSEVSVAAVRFHHCCSILSSRQYWASYFHSATFCGRCGCPSQPWDDEGNYAQAAEERLLELLIAAEVL